MKSSTTKGPKSIVKNVIFSLIITIFLFLFLESVARIGFTIKNRDPMYLFYGRTLIELRVRGLLRNVIGDDADERHRVNQYKIAVFGGSTVLGGHIPIESEWPETLERLLNLEGKRRVKVYNKGAGGNTSHHDVHRMRGFLRNHTPDTIILYTGVNDHALYRAAKIKGRYYLKDELETTFVQRLDAMLLKTSLFYWSLKKIYNKVGFHTANKVNMDKSKGASNIDYKVIELEKKGLDRFRGNLIEAISICRKLNIRIVLGTVPIILDRPGKKGTGRAGLYWDNEKWYFFYRKILAELRKTSKEFNVPLVDVAKRFEKMPKEGRELLFISDGVHLKESGNAKVARMFFDHLIQEIPANNN